MQINIEKLRITFVTLLLLSLWTSTSLGATSSTNIGPADATTRSVILKATGTFESNYSIQGFPPIFKNLYTQNASYSTLCPANYIPYVTLSRPQKQKSPGNVWAQYGTSGVLPTGNTLCVIFVLPYTNFYIVGYLDAVTQRSTYRGWGPGFGYSEITASATGPATDLNLYVTWNLYCYPPNMLPPEPYYMDQPSNFWPPYNYGSNYGFIYNYGNKWNECANYY